MCRTGGRRCPGCNGKTARAKHNARRRKNRAVKAAVVAWAEGQGRGTDAARLAAAPPIEAKRFIAENDIHASALGISLGPVSTPVAGEVVSPLAPAGLVGPSESGGAAAAGGRGAVEAVPFFAQHGLEVQFQAVQDLVGPERARRMAEELQRRDEPLFGRFPAPVAQAARRALVDQALEAARREQRARERAAAARAQQQSGEQSWRGDAQLLQQITAAQGRQGRLPVERLLLDSQLGAVTPVNSGVNGTSRVSLGAGQFAYHKPFDTLDDDVASDFGQSTGQQPVHEVAAWRLAERLGQPWEDMVAPCVLREVDGKLGSLSLERPGQVGQAPDAQPAAAFFDALIGQQDRHGGNALYDSTRGQTTLIDHGFAFSCSGDPVNASHFQDHRVRRGDPALSSQERAKLQELLASSDTFGLAGVLEPQRVEALRERAARMLSTGVLLGSRETW